MPGVPAMVRRRIAEIRSVDFISHWWGLPRRGKWWALAPAIRPVSLGTFVDAMENPPMTTAPEEWLNEILTLGGEPSTRITRFSDDRTNYGPGTHGGLRSRLGLSVPAEIARANLSARNSTCGDRDAAGT